jgi:hypothetical protein
VPGKPVRRFSGFSPIPDLCPQPQDGQGEGEAPEGRGGRSQLAQTHEDGRAGDAYGAGDQGRQGEMGARGSRPRIWVSRGLVPGSVPMSYES